MSLPVLNQKDICFYEMDTAIRKAAAARKRGDTVQDEYWRGKAVELAQKHGKQPVNAPKGKVEKPDNKQETKKRRDERKKTFLASLEERRLRQKQEILQQLSNAIN